MLLKNLIKKLPKKKGNISISGLTTNSAEVKKNYIFFAIKGHKNNGENFIKEAIIKGATVVVCSNNCRLKHKNILIFRTNKLKILLSKIASRFYKKKPKNIIAVTGTNGKTSIADIFFQALKLNKIPVASIGTLGIKYGNKIIKTNLTTPDTIAVHKYLDYFKRKKIENVIIEASSHGLDQKRLHFIKFKAGIFTNFSQDHLDYHKNMKSYLNSKLVLFREILSKKSVIISDNEIKPFSLLKLIALKKKQKLTNIKEEFEKIKSISSESTSNFRIKNLAMAIEATRLCGLKEKLIYKTLKRLKDVSGRLELVRRFPNNIKVYVDYAHTPDALFQTLKFLKNKYGNNISLVFGCGGDRDKKKRPLMARIADDNCKKAFITDDNPRSESPKKIRNELLKNFSKIEVLDIGNREFAIKTAIKNAGPHETILIAGKGHEEQQIYKNKIKYISDRKIVKQIKLKIKNLTKKQLNFSENQIILKKILGKTKLVNFSGISIDSRTIKKNNLFIALKGKKNNGNKFIKNALKKGAGCIISSIKSKEPRKKIIYVKNPISFLNDFAKFKREQSQAKTIAITGSAGKTSLKNLIKDLLQNFGQTHSSPKSFNNYLGVPISLSNLNNRDKYGVFEVGMSKSGEIKNLSNLIKPHIGVITNIGEAHLENFKNIKGIAKAKSEIMDNIKKGGFLVLNRDDKYFRFLQNKAKLKKLKIYTFGIHSKSDIRLKKIVKKENFIKIFISINNEIIHFEIKDLNTHNILASLAVLKALKLNVFKIKNKFKNFELSEGRGKRHLIKRYKKRFRFIDESYNANPLSVKNAIDKFSSIKKEKFKKFLILGDMLELGAQSKKYHEELSKVINNSDIDKVFIKGKKSIFTYKHLNKDKRGNILQNDEDIDLSLGKMISNDDYLMIKGSNATGLNSFSKKMIKGI